MTTTTTAGTRILPNSVTDRYARLAWIFQAVAEGGNQDLFEDRTTDCLAYSPDHEALDAEEYEGDWVEISYPYGFAGIETVRGGHALYWDYSAYECGCASFAPAAPHCEGEHASYIYYRGEQCARQIPQEIGWTWKWKSDATDRAFTSDPKGLAGLIESLEDEFFEAAACG